MSRAFQVTFDTHDPIAVSRFWAEVLGYILPGRGCTSRRSPRATSSASTESGIGTILV
ncbi:hypothetical protein JS278_01945 [Acidipropionibacterium virtanenii]|uniref:Glyoxalase-like domain-containing protein n=1 Tax=Acidipropionibacterium virtanenii TaxID=2057246 RepID=A0A344UV03_9ACTN|nr:hypothetical protein JS278_01945 [Acidipropionibacterium virtanenii]